MFKPTLFYGALMTVLATTSLAGFARDYAQKSTNTDANNFRNVLHKRIMARLNGDKAAYKATDAEFAERSARARTVAKTLYAQCPYWLFGLFSSTSKRSAACELLGSMLADMEYYSHIEDAIYFKVKAQKRLSEAENETIVARELKVYEQTVDRYGRVKNGLNRRLDPTRLSKHVAQKP